MDQGALQIGLQAKIDIAVPAVDVPVHAFPLVEENGMGLLSSHFKPRMSWKR
jgi:hypothetical protein